LVVELLPIDLKALLEDSKGIRRSQCESHIFKIISDFLELVFRVKFRGMRMGISEFVDPKNLSSSVLDTQNAVTEIPLAFWYFTLNSYIFRVTGKGIISSQL